MPSQAMDQVISAFWAQRSARAGQAPPTLEDQRAGQLQYPTFQAQGWPIGVGSWRAPTSWWSKRASKAPACTGRALMSTPYSSCATPPVTTAGTKPGR